MGIDEERIIALAEGRISPNNGMEVHFIRVVKGDAMPASQEEKDWLLAYRRAKGNDSAQTSAISGDLTFEIGRLKKQNESLIGRLESRNALLREADLSRNELEATVVQLRNELDSMREKLLAESKRANEHESASLLLREKYKALSDDVELRIQALIDDRHREIEQKNSRVVEKNKNLAALIVELNKAVRKEHTMRIKCPVCEGASTYYDMSTYRVGADYEGPRPVDVCGNCRGAGFIDNPKRDVIARAEAAIFPESSLE